MKDRLRSERYPPREGGGSASPVGWARLSCCMPKASRPLLALAIPMFVACAPEPVIWGAPAPLSAADSAVLAAADGSAASRVDISALPERCAGSLRLARVRAEEWHAAWWMPRADGSATLVAAHSRDGGRQWSAPTHVDSLERTGRGCDRPAPAIATDARTGYVHVAYFLDAPESPGLFFAHSMDAGRTFHGPVAIVYGDRPAAAAVAASGDTVVVAYEDPNASAPRIAVAISRSGGHIFEQRLPPISSASMEARVPRVAIRGRRLIVAWRERARDAQQGAGGVAMSRAGELR